MRKVAFSFLLILFSIVSSAHNLRYDNQLMRTWTNIKSGEVLNASFVVEKENEVVVQDASLKVHKLSLLQLSSYDRSWLASRRSWTKTINDVRVKNAESSSRNLNLIPILAVIILLGIVAQLLTTRGRNMAVLRPAMLLLCSASFFAFSYWKDQPVELDTDPSVINEAFEPFVPAVHTYYDDTYFYVESRGIPETHEMMVGISNHGWQQQVPIPQCYTGNNAWPIPLNPVLASNPIPVDDVHFTRGAIAIAVNGVPIFNVYTNTGVDSYLDGQLDNYGGHCGRADDYHYHIAPLHLYDYTNTALPIAYGLDGFAVYGALEPDQSPMQPLDENHGHVGSDGVYHYHGTAEAPYMIARMAGEVVEDATNQLVPQAAAHPVRPSLTPLNGALINMCVPNAQGNGYTLGYTFNGQQDSVIYSWTNDGQYTFNFYTTGDGVAAVEQYAGFDQCVVPVSMQELASINAIVVYPNPCEDLIRIRDFNGACCRWVLYSSNGTIAKQWEPREISNGTLDLTGIPAGIYYLECRGAFEYSMQKIVKK